MEKNKKGRNGEVVHQPTGRTESAAKGTGPAQEAAPMRSQASTADRVGSPAPSAPSGLATMTDSAPNKATRRTSPAPSNGNGSYPLYMPAQPYRLPQVAIMPPPVQPAMVIRPGASVPFSGPTTGYVPSVYYPYVHHPAQLPPAGILLPVNHPLSIPPPPPPKINPYPITTKNSAASAVPAVGSRITPPNNASESRALQTKFDINAEIFRPRASRVFDLPAFQVFRCPEEARITAGWKRPPDHCALRAPLLPPHSTQQREFLSFARASAWKAILELEERQRMKSWQSLDTDVLEVTIPAPPEVLSADDRVVMIPQELARERGVTQGLSNQNCVLAVVRIPGVLENRPYLRFDSAIWFRDVEHRLMDIEARVIELVQDIVLVRIAMPVDMIEVAPTIRHMYARFAMDDSLFSYMHSAITETATMNLEQYITEDAMPEDVFELLPVKCLDSKLTQDQVRAVAGVVHREGRFGLNPFIIFGPAGTGKTKVVAETVLQLLKNEHQEQRNRVLLCAPSEAACDVALLRIRDVKSDFTQPSDFLRVHAFKRRRREVGGSTEVQILGCSCLKNGVFACPSPERLDKARVVVATLETVGALKSLGLLKRGDFTHIIVDESSQALEPETLIAFSLAEPGKTELVLVGDPFQLNAATLSTEATARGLSASLQERLMCDRSLPYDRRDPRFIACLVTSFRSHPALLELPNRLFYNGRLVSGLSERETAHMQNWAEAVGIPSPDFPLVFYPHRGEDEHPVDSPNFRNQEEASICVELVSRITKVKGVLAVRPRDICIVCLFRSQVYLVREKLRKNGFWDVSVGTIDDVQGQEHPVVLVSTVLSKTRWLRYKEDHSTLGHIKQYVSDHKRFNVAITRAKMMCIVVGNIQFLRCVEKTWWKLVRVCAEKQAVMGSDECLSELLLALEEEPRDGNTPVDGVEDDEQVLWTSDQARSALGGGFFDT